MIKKRIYQLREIMAENNIDIYVIKTADYHQSEYTGEYFNEREFMSGFTGSAGTLVITKTEAALFTDGRYFIQAARQLMNSDIQLMKSGVEGTPTVLEYIESQMKQNVCVAFDGRTIEAAWGIELESILEKMNGTIKFDKDYIDFMWTERPQMSQEPAFLLNIKYAGESVTEKLSKIRTMMAQKHAKAHIVSTLDDICWMFNIRGNDVKHNPVVLAFGLITMEEAYIFTSMNKFSSEMSNQLAKDNIFLKPYEDIYEYVKNMGKSSLLVDTNRINYTLYKMIPTQADVVISENPSMLMKAVKNQVEIENLRKVHIKDGIALTKFIYWLKENMRIQGDGDCNDSDDQIADSLLASQITEISAANYLESCRKEQEGFIELSFDTICAYNSNAAMMHYSATSESNAIIKPEGMLLVDSGGQYFEGTTDVTRTIAVGPVTSQMKKDFTLTLKGMLNLSNAKFLYGCSGINLDILARGPLWNEGVDYRCGTGHGIGYLLNVHEAPNGFRWKHIPGRNDFCVLEEGMVTSNEPGVYVEGEYGIRIENIIVCKKGQLNEYGQFMEFETLTMAPIDMDLIDVEYLDKTDRIRINQYHKQVYNSLSPFLNEDEKKWLRKYTREI